MRGHQPADWRIWHCVQAWTLRGLIIAGLVLPGFGDVHRVAAQAPETDNAPFSLSYVPRDAVAFAAARPAALLSRPVLAPLRQALLKPTEGAFRLGVELDDLVETAIIVLQSNRGVSVATIVRTETPAAARQFVATLGQRPQPATFGETTYYRVGRTAYFLPDPRTIIFSPDEPALIRCIAAGPKGATTTNWADKWAAVGHRDAAAIVNTSLLRAIPNASAMLELSGNRNSRLQDSTSLQLAPLWQRSEDIVAELRVSDDIVLRLVSQSATDGEAEQVQSAMLTTVSLGRMLISQLKQTFASQADESTPILMTQLDLVDEILEKAKIVRQQAQVGLVARADQQVARQLVTAATPAVLSAQRVAYRTSSMNNLKQIALGFHNYHDTYKVFPAAVQIGPKNIPHSWRITILPFLDGGIKVYDKYRQDEPWDSDHNKQLLAEIPASYRSAADSPDSTNTSYFALLGQHSAFEQKRATRFADIIDGTSNTILVVESRLPVPWTKPQDIPFDAEGPLPAIGGWYPEGFCASMCDGSALFFPKEMSQLNLRHLIMRDDGQPAELPRR